MNVHAIRHSARAALHAARIAVVVAGTIVVAACATVAPTPAKTVDGTLTNAAGMTLYTFDRDVAGSGKSACVGPCAANWPAFGAAAGPSSAAGDWTVVTRDDGASQWAYKGRPLYTFAKDTKPGERTGDGLLNGAWHVARP